MLIVGSKALAYHFPNIERHVDDIDIIANRKDSGILIDMLKPEEVLEKNGLISLKRIKCVGLFNTTNVEILLSDNSDALSGYLLFDDKNEVVDDIGLKYASLKVLFSLKKSHIHFPISFKKHIVDYNILYDYFDGVDSLNELTSLNYKETEERVGKLKTPSLNKSVSKFFNQSNGFVKSYFIHDDMHVSVAHYGYPLYLDMQKDKTIAKCEKEMWEKFTFENKCKCILEEAYVIALERKVLPAIYGGAEWVSSAKALEWSLMRICTNLCSGWFRAFATDNFLRIKEYINDEYVEDFLTKVHKQEIMKLNS